MKMGGSCAASADTRRDRETQITGAVVASALSDAGMGGSSFLLRKQNA